MSQHYYNIVKRAIGFGDYELTAMLSKIESSWFEGKLSDGEKAELVELVRVNADPLQSVDIIKTLADHEKRIKALEQAGVVTPPAPPEPPVSDEYPPFDKDKKYLNGDKCSENGKKYICKLPEWVDICTWAPSVYPAYWEEVTTA